MKNYAEVNLQTNLVVNMIVFQNDPLFDPPVGHIYVETTDVNAAVGYSYIDGVFVAPPPPPAPPLIFVPKRVTKARFGDLFTFPEHAIMNMLRWQITQMDAADRSNPSNPLVFAEVLFQKFDLPAEFIELDHPLTIQGLGILGMMGVFSGNDAVRIPQILNDETAPQ